METSICRITTDPELLAQGVNAVPSIIHPQRLPELRENVLAYASKGRVGDQVVIYSRGRYRLGTIAKKGRSRLAVRYSTPSGHAGLVTEKSVKPEEVAAYFFIQDADRQVIEKWAEETAAAKKAEAKRRKELAKVLPERIERALGDEGRMTYSELETYLALDLELGGKNTAERRYNNTKELDKAISALVEADQVKRIHTTGGRPAYTLRPFQAFKVGDKVEAWVAGQGRRQDGEVLSYEEDGVLVDWPSPTGSFRSVHPEDKLELANPRRANLEASR